jgi:hypothetical protein
MTRLLAGLGLLTALSSTLVFISTPPCQSCTLQDGCGECTDYVPVRFRGVWSSGQCVPCQCAK